MYRISTNSFSVNYSFLKVAIFYFIHWIVGAETIEGGKRETIQGRKYSQKYGISFDMVDWAILELRQRWDQIKLNFLNYKPVSQRLTSKLSPTPLVGLGNITDWLLILNLAFRDGLRLGLVSFFMWELINSDLVCSWVTFRTRLMTIIKIKA